jgi:hypothetical protein
MADPRADGPPYWKCEKPLIDHALSALTPVEFKVVFAVERKTTGHYEKKDAEISIGLQSDLDAWRVSRRRVSTSDRGPVALREQQ